MDGAFRGAAEPGVVAAIARRRRMRNRLELADKETLDGELKAVISDGRVLLLPVVDDGIDSSKVTTPEGVKMTKVSPCKL